MTMKLKISAVAAAAILASTAAHATLTRMNIAATGPGGGGNSNVAFIALDSTGTPASLMVDLGYLLTDFIPVSTPDGFGQGSMVGLGQTAVWNFNTNTHTLNGVAQSGTYNWSAEYAEFQAAAQAGETKFGVIAGAIGGYPNYYLTTGNPTATQLTNQTTVDTSNMGLVDTLYNANLTLGTMGLPGEGANATVGLTTAQSGYVGATGNFGTTGMWKTTLKWNATVAEGATNRFFYLDNDIDAEVELPGTMSYAAGVLTWQTAPVPEPSTYMLALAGLAVLGFVARRRRNQQ